MVRWTHAHQAFRRTATQDNEHACINTQTKKNSHINPTCAHTHAPSKIDTCTHMFSSAHTWPLTHFNWSKQRKIAGSDKRHNSNCRPKQQRMNTKCNPNWLPHLRENHYFFNYGYLSAKCLPSSTDSWAAHWAKGQTPCTDKQGNDQDKVPLPLLSH